MASYRLRYQTIEVGEFDFHLRTLRDKQQFYDPLDEAKNLGISSSFWPLFGVVWPSSIVLANVLLDMDINNKRILEVGCGIGLASLLLTRKKADITASDYHPEAENFLVQNAALNDENTIAFERLDWNDTNTSLGQFDLIVGSDLLYEDEHVAMLTSFIHHHAKPCSEVVLVDAGRGWKNKFTTAMAAFGFSHKHYKPERTDYLDSPFKGYVLTFKRG